MTAVATVLDYILVAFGCAAGILAATLHTALQRRGVSAPPPLRFGSDTLRDFEMLLAAQATLLFGFTVYLAASYLEFAALAAASRVPGIMFTLILILLLFRWRRRVV